MTVLFDLMPCVELSANRLAYLERDRWRELRRLWEIHFTLCQWNEERPRWSWLVNRCRKREEVERVLNRHSVEYDWKHRRAVPELEDAEIFRVS